MWFHSCQPRREIRGCSGHMITNRGQMKTVMKKITNWCDDSDFSDEYAEGKVRICHWLLESKVPLDQTSGGDNNDVFKNTNRP